MTWNTFHRRGEILQNVVETADARADGALPMDLPGVAETFRDELDLLAALWLKWNARLFGTLEGALAEQPLDLEGAVAAAWCRTREQMPGVRLILDRYVDSPTSEEMATAVARASEKEWIRLAAAAGLASDESAAAARAGRKVELRARAEATEQALLADAPKTVEGTPSLVERIKAVLAA